MEVILISIIFSFVASLLSSMLGGGFGLISVPTIYWVLVHYYPYFDHKMQMTITTGSACAIILGLFSSLKHYKYNNIDFCLYKKIILYMIVGVLTAVIAMNFVHSDIIKRFFSVIVFLTGLWMLRFNINNVSIINISNYLMKSIGVLLGFISCFIGISVFNVPFFVKQGINIKKAIGTSGLLVFSYSTIGAVALISTGIIRNGISSSHIGYLITPIFISSIIPCYLGSMVGAKMVNLFSPKQLKNLFVSMLFIVAFLMVI